MQLNHIGLNISDVSEVKHFYQDVLGLQLERGFDISRPVSQKFFGINGATKVFIVRNAHLRLELFVYDSPLKMGYGHLCVEVADREQTVLKCEEKLYRILRMKREKGDLLFVKDKAGNIFELKNMPDENLS
jgi:catechol 2,3-dioxygenase-like lactoylglutathione lyase family enzyme